MPYASNSDLPKPQTKNYSGHQKSAFREAFNSALKTYGGKESTAFAVANAAAKRTPVKKRAS